MQGIHRSPPSTSGRTRHCARRPPTTVEGVVNLKYNDVLMAVDVFRAKLNVFHNTVDDFIGIQSVGPSYFVPAIAAFPPRSAPLSPGGFPCVIPVRDFPVSQQSPRAELNGVELEGSYDWGGGFVTLAATHTDGATGRRAKP